MDASLEGPDELKRLQRPGLELWVRAADEDWLRDAGIEEVERPEQLQGARVLSRRGRGASILVEGAGRTLIAKTLRHGGGLGSVLGECFLGASRLHGVRRIIDALRARAVSTPAVGFLRVHRRLGRCRLEVATEYLAGTRDLDSYLGSSPEPPGRRDVLCSTGKLLAGMHEAGVLHADLNLRNILVLADGSTSIIDLEGSHLGSGSRGPRERVGNWARLYRSLCKREHWPARTPEGLVRADLEAALRCYDPEGWPLLSRRIEAAHRRSRWRHPWTWQTPATD